MALSSSLTSARIAETCLGLYCIASLLCFGIIKCVPLGTSTLISSVEPSTATMDSAEGSITVTCGSADDGPADIATVTPDESAADLKILIGITSRLNSDINKTFHDYKEHRYGPGDVELIPIDALPDISKVSDPGLNISDRMATHYFILQGHHTAMSAVIQDENDINITSRKFDEEFETMKRDLGKVMSRTQSLVCMRPDLRNGASGVGELDEQDLGFNADARTNIKFFRDYIVLYNVRQHITKFYQDLFSLSTSRD